MRVMVSAGFDVYTGYGNDAVDMCVWLNRMGVDVVPWPSSILPGLPREFLQLLSKDPSGDYDVALRFAPPFDVRPSEFAGLGRVAVGWSMWEKTPIIRADMKRHGWAQPDRRVHWWSKGPRTKKGREKNWLDLMVVTCHDNVDAFQSLDDGLPYAVVPNGIDPERFPVLERPRDRQMVFASIGMLAGRKDPFATLQAWRLAKEMDPSFDAKLILKTGCAGLHPQIAAVYPDVEIITSMWSPQRVLQFYSEVDVLVSTSRGEGNNKPAMEFMATGGPVMATDWSGHRNWLHPDTGYPLPGTLVGNSVGVFDFRVDVEATARTFLEVWRGRAEARRKGELAAQQIRATLSWEKVLERLLREIGRVM